MDFTLEHGIVLLIVVAILFIYRQLDRNNRSLDKVRKYADKVKEDLDALVSEKAQNLKDLSIELDVHQKTAREILKRVQSMEDQMQNRLDDVDTIGQRIREYDKTLEELIQMTRRVEENMQRLRDESEHVEKVSRRIKALGDKMDEQEKQIPKMVDQFRDLNSQGLQKVQDATMQRTREDLAILERKISDAADSYEQYQSRVEDLKQTSDATANRIADELDDLRVRLLEESRKAQEKDLAGYGNRLDEMIATMDDRQQRAGEAFTAMEARAEKILAGSHATLEQKLQQFTSSWKSVEEDFTARLDKIASEGVSLETKAFAAMRADMDQKVARLRDELEAMLLSERDAMDTGRKELFDGFGRLRADVEVWSDQLKTSYADLDETYARKFSEREYKIEEQLRNLNTSVGNAQSDFNREIEKLLAENMASLKDYQTTVRDRLDALQDGLYRGEKGLEEKIQEANERLVRQMDQVMTKASQDLEARAGAVASQIEYRLKDAESRSEQTRAKLQEEFEGVNQRVAQWIEQTDDTVGRIQNQVNEFSRYTETSMREQDHLLHDHVAQSQQRVQQLESDVAARMGLLNTAIANTDLNLQEKMRQISSDSEAKISGIASTIDSTLRKQEENLGVIRDRLQADLGAAQKDILAKLTQIRTESEVFGGEIIEHTRAIAKDTEAAVQAKLTELSREHANIAALNQETVSRVEQLKETLLRETGTLEQKLREFAREYADRIIRTGEGMEQKVISELDAKLVDLERDISYRFSRVETISGDLTALEENLHQSMEKVSSRIQVEFNQFGQQLRESQASDRAGLESAMDGIRQGMNALEKGLNDLKSRAYDSMSERLKVFEDDFFQDLKNRSETMQIRMVEWQSSLHQQVEALSREHTEKRGNLEERYTTEMRESLQDIQEKTRALNEKFQQQVQEFQDAVRARVQYTEQALKDFEVRIQQEVEDTRLSSEQHIRQEYAKHSASIEETLSKGERQVDDKLTAIKATLEVSLKENKQMLEASRTDLVAWQTRTVQDFTRTEQEINQDVTAFKSEVNQTISSIRSDFLSQRDDLVTGTNEERLRLKQELASLQAAVVQLEDDLRKKTDEVLKQFNVTANDYSVDFSRKNREIHTETEQRLREFRSFVQDAREQFDLSQQKMLTKAEEQYKTLSVNLQEIDKRQKAFVEQTKLFERADSLKLSLQQSMEELKGDLSRVTSQMKELREIETQFVKVRKLGEEVSEKMSRFVAEKRRLDTLDDDYKKLSALSMAVEQKLAFVTSSNDNLQAMQISIRDLESKEQEVEQRYERLEKKRGVLDATINGVDKNFQTLSTIENQLSTVSSSLAGLSEQTDQITQRVQALSANKDKADTVVRLLDGLDNQIATMEQRLNELQKAREWLASTETRLENIAQEAQDQVKLLGSLIKDDLKAAKKDKSGTPSYSSRDMVTRLAHQGWTVDQIAGATKLSKGEVELILEMTRK